MVLELGVFGDGELEGDERPLICGLDLLLSRLTVGGLPVGTESAGTDVALVAEAACEGPFIGVETLVELEVDILGEAGAALLTTVWLGARVQPQVGLQVGC